MYSLSYKLFFPSQLFSNQRLKNLKLLFYPHQNTRIRLDLLTQFQIFTLIPRFVLFKNVLSLMKTILLWQLTVKRSVSHIATVLVLILLLNLVLADI